MKGNVAGSNLDVTVEDPDLTEVVIFVPVSLRGKIFSTQIAAFNEIGIGPFSEPSQIDYELSEYSGNELTLENSSRYTWLIAMFGSLVFMLILVMSVLVYYRKRNLYHRKTVTSNQVYKYTIAIIWGLT